MTDPRLLAAGLTAVLLTAMGTFALPGAPVRAAASIGAEESSRARLPGYHVAEYGNDTDDDATPDDEATDRATSDDNVDSSTSSGNDVETAAPSENNVDDAPPSNDDVDTSGTSD